MKWMIHTYLGVKGQYMYTGTHKSRYGFGMLVVLATVGYLMSIIELVKIYIRRGYFILIICNY